MPWDRFTGLYLGSEPQHTQITASLGESLTILGKEAPNGNPNRQFLRDMLSRVTFTLDTFSKHVLTEDIVHREVTPDQKLLSRRLLTKTNRMPRWAERLFPANVAHSVYILEDSIVDPQNQTMTTFTWNINHARLMVRPFGSPHPKKKANNTPH